MEKLKDMIKDKTCLVLHLFWFLWSILSLFDYPYSGQGVGMAFTFWFFAFGAAAVCMLFYYVEAIKSLIKKLNLLAGVKLLILIACTVSWFYLAGDAALVPQIVWHVLFISLFIFELVCVILREKKKKVSRKDDSPDPEG